MHILVIYGNLWRPRQCILKRRDIHPPDFPLLWNWPSGTQACHSPSIGIRVNRKMPGQEDAAKAKILKKSKIRIPKIRKIKIPNSPYLDWVKIQNSKSVISAPVYDWNRTCWKQRGIFKVLRNYSKYYPSYNFGLFRILTIRDFCVLGFSFRDSFGIWRPSQNFKSFPISTHSGFSFLEFWFMRDFISLWF